MPTAASTRPIAEKQSRSIRSSDVDLVLNPARDVLALWKSTTRTGSGDGRSRRRAAAIASTAAYRTLREFYRRQYACLATEADVARALELPDSGICGFGMDPAYQSQSAIRALVTELELRGRGLREQIAKDAARYLPRAPDWKPVTVWFVLASQAMFDAVTLDPASSGLKSERGEPSVGGGEQSLGRPVIIINLTEVLSYGETPRARIDALEHVLAHELFHAGMRQVESRFPGWSWYDPPRDETAYIARMMLDEGVAHYVDWRERPGADSLFTWKPSSREARAFAQLATAIRRVHQPGEDPYSRMEVVQLAGHGPLWSKYGAISGMFAAHRIEMARGPEALRRAVVGGPLEFLRVYREVAAKNPQLYGIPKELIQQQ